MTNRTPLQQAIDHLTKEGLKTGNSNKDVIAYLESQLKEERKIFVQYALWCSMSTFTVNDGYVNFDENPADVFDYIFSEENEQIDFSTIWQTEAK